MRVPMRGTGAEQPVVVMKSLEWRWSEGAASFGFIGGINQRWEESFE